MKTLVTCLLGSNIWSSTHNTVQSSVMAKYLQCIADDLDDTLTTKVPFEGTLGLENKEKVIFEDLLTYLVILL